MYSAIKVNGRKLYELAREGKEVERKTRLIHIFNISDIKSLGDNKFAFKVLCSKGTYIRTLCKDIGEKLGCGGCMSKLTRSRSGNFYLENSIKIDDFKKLVGEGNINDVLISMDVILGAWTSVQGARRVLDVGTGTGLVALMLAQRSPSRSMHTYGRWSAR